MISLGLVLNGPSYQAVAVGCRKTTLPKPLRDGGGALWDYVIPHFNQFLKELELTSEERADADSKTERVARCLWDKYYVGEFSPTCYVKVGSFGKGTATRPPSDLDMLFLLPAHEYQRIQSLAGNKQSQLLQQVKRTLLVTFPRTDLRADGQVVAAPFLTYSVEIAPAFKLKDGAYWTAHSPDDGSWRRSNPAAELAELQYADSVSAGKATDLVKMLKAWKRDCSVDIKSISLEVFVCAFVTQWQYRLQTVFYYDWMVRDFFEFMLRYSDRGWTKVPGTEEIIQLGDAWVSKAQSAYDRAVKACEYERRDLGNSAALEWQKIFGDQFEAKVSLRDLIAMAATSAS
jgi:hypothetical protein